MQCLSTLYAGVTCTMDSADQSGSITAVYSDLAHLNVRYQQLGVRLLRIAQL